MPLEPIHLYVGDSCPKDTTKGIKQKVLEDLPPNSKLEHGIGKIWMLWIHPAGGVNPVRHVQKVWWSPASLDLLQHQSILLLGCRMTGNVLHQVNIDGRSSRMSAFDEGTEVRSATLCENVGAICWRSIADRGKGDWIDPAKVESNALNLIRVQLHPIVDTQK